MIVSLLVADMIVDIETIMRWRLLLGDPEINIVAVATAIAVVAAAAEGAARALNRYMMGGAIGAVGAVAGAGTVATVEAGAVVAVLTRTSIGMMAGMVMELGEHIGNHH